MSASVDDRKKYAETVRVYLIISVLCAVYGMIYELFSHKVYSLYMIFAFVIQLLGGTINPDGHTITLADGTVLK